MGHFVDADPKTLRSLANQTGESSEIIRRECQELDQAINELRPTIDSNTFERIRSILESIHPAVKSGTLNARVMQERINAYADALEIIRKG